MNQTAPQVRPKPRKVYDPDRNVRNLITPEGIDLRLRLADTGSRIGAFFIDLTIMIITLIIFTIVLSYTFSRLGQTGVELGIVIWILGFFILRNFYFMFFEMGPKGATPGKRLVKIRVASRTGGHLTPSAVFARNAMREIEFFLPLSFAFSGQAGIGGWMVLLGLVWSLIFLLFPLFNKDHLRGGDLIGGTWVVQAPRVKLSSDLAGAPKTKGRYVFTPAQVDAYGVKELHVLETVLRRNNPKTVAEVTERIMTKIEWPDPQKVGNTNAAHREFLNAYYAAMRSKLETKLLFGVRRIDKYDRR